MKKILIALSLILVFSSLSFAGEIRTTPEYIVLTEPTTNQVELIEQKYFYGSNPSVLIRFNILDSTGVVREKHTIRIQNILDNPETISVNCVDIGDPYPNCTGAGTCENDCDESTTDFTDFVSGFGATMKTRGDTAIWQFIQEKYETQATP